MDGYSVIISNVDACCDRYMSGGYGKKYDTTELFERLGKLGDIKGVELVSGRMLDKDSVCLVKEMIGRSGLQVVSVIPDHSGRPLWAKGAFTAPDRKIRKAAVDETYKCIDIAREFGCKIVSIWNGQDGYDYPLQMDYETAHRHLAEGIRQCADYAPDIRLSIEYKPKEPRNHSFVSNVHSTLLLIEEIDRENVGLTLDTGHSLLAYENMAEAAVTALKYGKLFHMHFNDNYRLWDDDMIAGSIHTIEFIELFYWLERGGYDGWISLDQYPYREDGVEAVNQSVKWLEAFRKAAASLDKEKVSGILAKHDAVASTALLRELFFI